MSKYHARSVKRLVPEKTVLLDLHFHMYRTPMHGLRLPSLKGSQFRVRAGAHSPQAV